MWATKVGGVVSKCIACGYSSDGIVLRCPRCWGLVILEYEGLRWRVNEEEASMWRYSSLLPGFDRRVSLGEGLTPVRKVGTTYVKLETANPTGSYADRASSVLASYIASAGTGRVLIRYAEDFTYSLATYLRGLADVRVSLPKPAEVDPLEVLSLAELGVAITFEGGENLVYENSLTVEGLKTIAYEVVEKSTPVGRIVVPVETGLLAFALVKGLREAREAGVDVNYEVVGAVVEGGDGSTLLSWAPEVRVVSVGLEEAVESMVLLARKGIRAKLLSAAAVAVASRLGNSLAVITAGYGRRRLRKLYTRSKVGREILRALRKLGEATAYEIWSELGGRFSLRGVYKSLASLEEQGLVFYRYVVKGGRKVKVYKALER
ncbi:MAG: pyridoxal-phosphate dependent enzyme [Desulfurococcaceae archaeon]|nr:pyridoxal-phosphate dependent enzyme [Desulfurococcaceae archaeon]